MLTNDVVSFEQPVPDVFDFPYVKRSFSFVHAPVYRLISPIILKCRSMKTDSDESKYSSFFTRVTFSRSGNQWLINLLT